MSEDADAWAEIDLGETVFDGDGNRLGTVRGFDEDGFYVTLRKGLAALSIAHVHPRPDFGEAELTWRCADCGEVDDLDDDLPERCPNCGTERENLYYWLED